MSDTGGNIHKQGTGFKWKLVLHKHVLGSIRTLGELKSISMGQEIRRINSFTLQQQRLDM